MTTRAAEPGIAHRRLRTAARAGYLLVAIGLIWLVVSRWNGVPAVPMTTRMDWPPLPPINPQRDRTKALTAALAAIPVLPAITLPPAPAGKRWATRARKALVDPSGIVSGPWTPDTRPNMQSVIQYLQAPALDAALAQLAGIEPGGCRMAWQSLSSVRKAAMILVARARYRNAGLDDPDGALADLETVFRLSSIIYDSSSFINHLTAGACEDLAIGELLRLSHERRLTARQAERITASVQAMTPDKGELLRRIIAVLFDPLDRAVDATYTDDGQGDGWLVLSSFDNSWQPTPGTEPRSGVWNLLSPLLNGRHAVCEKIDARRKAFRSVIDLPYAKARSILESVDSKSPFTIVDGPAALAAFYGLVSRRFEWAIRDVARRRAVLVAAALSAYRTEHGGYPNSLTELLGTYLDALPLDPYDDQPLRYILKPAENDFLLYAVGPDLVDDGGEETTKPGGAPWWQRNGDVLFSRQRAEPQSEPKLEAYKP